MTALDKLSTVAIVRRGRVVSSRAWRSQPAWRVLLAVSA